MDKVHTELIIVTMKASDNSSYTSEMLIWGTVGIIVLLWSGTKFRLDQKHYWTNSHYGSKFLQKVSLSYCLSVSLSQFIPDLWGDIVEFSTIFQNHHIIISRQIQQIGRNGAKNYLHEKRQLMFCIEQFD